MKIHFVTEGSVNEYWENSKKTACDLLAFGFGGLGEVDYRRELSGETNKLEDMAIMSRELDCTVVIDLKTNGDDHLQVVVFYLAADLAAALSLNYPKISDSCILLQFPIFIYFLDVIVDRPDIYIIEGSHHFLSQPDILVFVAHFYALGAVAGGSNKG